MGEQALLAVGRRGFLKTAATAALGAGASLLGACAAAVRAPAQVRGRVAESIQVGVLVPAFAAFPQVGESTGNGLRLYFESVDGEAAGRLLRVVYDDDPTPDVSGELVRARRLVGRTGVNFLVGMVTQPAARLIYDLLESGSPVPVLLADEGTAYHSTATGSPGAFRVSFTWWQLSHPLGEWAYYNIARRVYVSSVASHFGQESADSFKRGFAHAGVAVVAESQVPPATRNFTEEFGRIARARVDAAYACYAGDDAVAFVQQFAAAGLNRDVRLVGPGLLTSEDLLTEQAAAALGGITSLHWALTLDTPENVRFRQAYQQRFGREPDLFALQGYDAGRVIVEAVNQVQGDLSNRGRLQEAVAGVRFRSPRGPFRFDADSRVPIQNVYIRDVKDQKGILGNVVLETVREVRDPGRTAQGG